MDQSRLPESMRRRMAERENEPPLETVRKFIGVKFGDAEGIDEVRKELEDVAAISTRSHVRNLRAIESVLAAPQEPDTLARLVGWDGNWVLDDPSDAGAAEFLREVAQMLREIIAQAPGRAGSASS